MKDCKVCSKRVRGYDIHDAACPTSEMILGFIVTKRGLKLDSRQLARNIQWSIGKVCEFRICGVEGRF